MIYSTFTTEEIQDIILNQFSQAVHDGQYSKVHYDEWRQLRNAIWNSPLSAEWYIMSYKPTECEDIDADDLLARAFLIIAPTLHPESFSYNNNDNSLGSFIWQKTNLSKYYGYDNNMPKYIEQAIIDAFEDGIITLTYEAMPPLYYTTSIYTKNNKDKEENKIMNFNFDFGPCGDTVKLSMYGIAVKNASGNYVSYDRANGEIIDVDILNFDGGKYCYKIPVAINGIKVGDTVIHAKKPMFVVGINDTNLVVVDVVAGEEKTIIPTKNMFGFNYATKIVSIVDSFGGFSASEDNPFGNMLPLMLLSDNEYSSNNDMMLAMMLMNGNGAMDFAKNPMMLYLLMNKEGSKDIDPFMMMMLVNATGGALSAPTLNANAVNSVSKEVTAIASNPIVKLP